MRNFFLGAFAFEFEHAALRLYRDQTASAQFRRFFHQPVHSLVGHDARPQMNLHTQFSLKRLVLADAHGHITAAHVRDHRFGLPALAIEQGQCVARLQTQHLHMARCAWGQCQLVSLAQGCRAMKTRRGVRQKRNPRKMQA